MESPPDVMTLLICANQDLVNLLITTSLRIASAIDTDPNFKLDDERMTEQIKARAKLIRAAYCEVNGPDLHRQYIIRLSVEMTEMLFQQCKHNDVTGHFYSGSY
jgi:hypothetical protein